MMKYNLVADAGRALKMMDHDLVVPLLTFILAFAITYAIVPAIINFTRAKKLFDQPTARKQHRKRISSLGGVAVFAGMILPFLIFNASHDHFPVSALLVALIVLFYVGVKDDLYPLSPIKKFLGQCLSAVAIVVLGDLRIESLYGFLGIDELPYLLSVGLTILFFVTLINAFNFIDGIDGLCSSLTLVISLAYTWCFFQMDKEVFMVLAIALAGAHLAFLCFNLVNAKIFMGDNGSMIVGFMVSVLTISFIQINGRAGYNGLMPHVDAITFCMALLFVPFFDMVRVIFYRLFIMRVSPTHADRNHIHHKLLDTGMTDAAASISLSVVTLLLAIIAFSLKDSVPAKWLIPSLIVGGYGLLFAPKLFKKKSSA
jgi:UDP-N-acetylmuramyl pentapeptide phosphotransferase/UDP-N-acetylglucosamine-1-phosphate transferase